MLCNTNPLTTTHGYDYDDQRVWKKVGTQATTTYASKYFEKQGATTTDYIFLPNGDATGVTDPNYLTTPCTLSTVVGPLQAFVCSDV